MTPTKLDPARVERYIAVFAVAWAVLSAVLQEQQHTLLAAHPSGGAAWAMVQGLIFLLNGLLVGFVACSVYLAVSALVKREDPLLVAILAALALWLGYCLYTRPLTPYFIWTLTEEWRTLACLLLSNIGASIAADLRMTALGRR